MEPAGAMSKHRHVCTGIHTQNLRNVQDNPRRRRRGPDRRTSGVYCPQHDLPLSCLTCSNLSVCFRSQHSALLEMTFLNSSTLLNILCELSLLPVEVLFLTPFYRYRSCVSLLILPLRNTSHNGIYLPLFFLYVFFHRFTGFSPAVPRT